VRGSIGGICEARDIVIVGLMTVLQVTAGVVSEKDNSVMEIIVVYKELRNDK
jgi:hypothetical protein